MTQDKKELIEKLIVATEMYHIPIAKGSVLTFQKGKMIPEENPGINGGNPWGSFTSKEGQRVSFSQLLRYGNGINYGDIKSPTEALKALVELNEKKDVILKVKNRIVMEAVSREGKNCYLVFEPFNVA